MQRFPFAILIHLRESERHRSIFRNFMSNFRSQGLPGLEAHSFSFYVELQAFFEPCLWAHTHTITFSLSIICLFLLSSPRLLRLNHHEELVPRRHVLSVNFTEISSANNNSFRANEAFASNYDNWVNFVYFYSIILCTLLYFTVHRSFLFFKLCLRASVRIHDRLFCGVTRATLRFFECNPLRQILSHFTADIEKLDNQVPIAIYDSITVTSQFPTPTLIT